MKVYENRKLRANFDLTWNIKQKKNDTPPLTLHSKPKKYWHFVLNFYPKIWAPDSVTKPKPDSSLLHLI